MSQSEKSNHNQQATHPEYCKYYLRGYLWQDVKNRSSSLIDGLVKLLIILVCLRILTGDLYLPYAVVLFAFVFVYVSTNAIIHFVKILMALKKNKPLPSKFVNYIRQNHTI